MAASVYQVCDKGIFRSLPVYDDSLEGLTAIITGANGISGQYMMRALAEYPRRWSKIYCLSRRPPVVAGGLPPNVQHIPLDFLKSPEEIGEVLKAAGVKADHVFFFSYIQVEPKPGSSLWSNAEEMCKVNTKLLSNFLEALIHAKIKPQRILLQTGAKNYGVHLGRTVIPQEESDPRIELEPNFYYTQEDYLWKYCKEQGIGWNICMPSFILGAVPDAAMNVLYPLGVYVAVTKALGENLEYPGGPEAWESPQSLSTSTMNAYLSEWAVLSPKAKNQKFNAIDDSAFTWGKFWPRLAKQYGIKSITPDPNSSYRAVKQTYSTPPRGYGSNPDILHKFTLVEWAKRPEVQAAWKELAATYDLHNKDLRSIEEVFSFTDAALSWSQSLYFSADKARSMGWHGHVNSEEAIFAVLKEFEEMKMTPPFTCNN